MRTQIFSHTYPTYVLVGGTSRPAGKTVFLFSIQISKFYQRIWQALCAHWPVSQVHLSHCHQQSVSPLREHLNVTISVAAWRSVTQCDATWRDDHSISRVSLPSSAPLSPLASIDQQPTQTLSTLGSPAYTALSPQLILELIVPVVTSVNISSHWVGMYACTSQCHPADLHHGDQVRYCQQCGF